VWDQLNDASGTATGIQQFWDRVAFTTLQKSVYDPNNDAVMAVNDLSGSGRHQAILDSRHRPAASHHAKSVILKNGAGLVAYVGGIDIHSNRTNGGLHTDHAPGEFYHDIQCKIEGPAARDVLRTFISRWNDHPLSDSPSDPYNGKTADMQCLDLGFQAPGHAVPLDSTDDRVGGTCLAQIARTFGNCSGMVGVDRPHGNRFRTNDGYAFAPQGEFGVEAAVLTAIKRARKYIYIEDQYLGNLKVATAVADKIKEHKDRGERFFVYIVTPDMPRYEVDVLQALNQIEAVQVIYRTMTSLAPSITGPIGAILEAAAQKQLPIDRVLVDQSWAYLQNRWQDILGSVDPAREHWQMFCLRLPSFDPVVATNLGNVARQLGLYSTLVPIEDRRIYVHTKTVIVDDVWAMIGSANMNVRSYTMDTEIACCFIDGAVDDRGRRVAVRRYRQLLWAEHLDMRTTDPRLDLDPEDPKMTQLWTSRTTDADPKDYAIGLAPHGSRVYVWPRRDAVAANFPPVVTWTKNNQSVEVLGVTQLPQYWWVVEEYGKATWGANCSMLRPPAIGSADPRFAFDGQTGEAYKAFDLQLHSDCSN
jgi:phosphatidylserine/phosphatidylglycerophosphate/cardiolipin synthase-like enzyme